MLNIYNLTLGCTMLGCNLPTYMQAFHWLEYYRQTYGHGQPYPNGEGFYEGEFIIVRELEELPGVYLPIQ